MQAAAKKRTTCDRGHRSAEAEEGPEMLLEVMIFLFFFFFSERGGKRFPDSVKVSPWWIGAPGSPHCFRSMSGLLEVFSISVAAPQKKEKKNRLSLKLSRNRNTSSSGVRQSNNSVPRNFISHSQKLLSCYFVLISSYTEDRLEKMKMKSVTISKLISRGIRVRVLAWNLNPYYNIILFGEGV